MNVHLNKEIVDDPDKIQTQDPTESQRSGGQDKDEYDASHRLRSRAADAHKDDDTLESPDRHVNMTPIYELKRQSWKPRMARRLHVRWEDELEKAGYTVDPEGIQDILDENNKSHIRDEVDPKGHTNAPRREALGLEGHFEKPSDWKGSRPLNCTPWRQLNNSCPSHHGGSS